MITIVHRQHILWGVGVVHQELGLSGLIIIMLDLLSCCEVLSSSSGSAESARK